MLAQGDAIGLWTIGLSARIDCGRVDCWPKAMPLGYVLLGFQPVLIVGKYMFFFRIYYLYELYETFFIFDCIVYCECIGVC